MGLKLTLTDDEIPISPSFVEFLYNTIKGEAQHVGEWFRQDEESLASNQGRFEGIQEKANFVLSDKGGKACVLQSYRLFKELLTGKPEVLKHFQKYHFYFVVGIPRTGGTYLTKQLFRAADIDYTTVQNALAHDGFPHLAQLSFKKGNANTNGLLQLAEYLTMVDVFFKGNKVKNTENRIIVPKKFTKAVYNFGLIKEVFGKNAHFIITVRHPLEMIQSVLDKSGGMPKGKKFQIRSTIERWAMEDWIYYGTPEEEVKKMAYIDVLLGYWKRYHYQIAMAAIPTMEHTMVVPYGVNPMEQSVKTLFKELGSGLKPEAFKVSEPPKFTKTETAKAQKVVDDVAHFWQSMGLKFPAKDISAA